MRPPGRGPRLAAPGGNAGWRYDVETLECKAVKTVTPILTLMLSVALAGCPKPHVAPPPAAGPAHAPAPQVFTPPPGDLPTPPAARQLAEGYWLGALFTERHVPAMRAMGVGVVLSAVAPSDETLDALREAGIEQVYIPIGSTFRHAATILETTARYRPEQVFIHCQHGVDRTGAIAAFLLVTRHGWPVSDALYGMVNPSETDVSGLARVLERYGLTDPRSAGDPGVGTYSLTGAGVGYGGMKVRSENYVRLVSTAIDAMAAEIASGP